jgi:hypothetical protein
MAGGLTMLCWTPGFLIGGNFGGFSGNCCGSYGHWKKYWSFISHDFLAASLANQVLHGLGREERT